MTEGNKTAVEIILALVIIAAVAVFAFLLSENKSTIPEAGLRAGEKAGNKTTAYTGDTDGDGIPDWEETLRGTDPQTKDTDGDGTPDGEEVATGRNPLVAGPDDARAFYSSETTPKKPSGESLSELFTSALGSLQEKPVQKEVSDPLRAYGNAVGTILSDVFLKSREFIPDFAALIEDLSDEDARERLQNLSVVFSNAADEVEAIPPAEAVASLNTNISEKLSALSTLVSGMATAHTEQTLAEAARRYNAGVSELISALDETANLLETAGIRYSYGEGGYIFTVRY